MTLAVAGRSAVYDGIEAAGRRTNYSLTTRPQVSLQARNPGDVPPPEWRHLVTHIRRVPQRLAV